MKIKKENVYCAFSSRNAERTSIGIKQFIDHDTHGIKPENPDEYYLKLWEGKKRLDWQRAELKNSIRKFYGLSVTEQPSTDFQGWLQLRLDWENELHILKDLLSWCDFYPKWLFEKEIP